MGKALLAHSSVPGPRGGGVEARASDGATQPEVAAVLGFSASWRYSSRLTGSAGLASKALRSERPVLRGTGCVVQELWEIAKEQTLPSKP